MNCKKCNKDIPASMLVDDKRVSLTGRVYCTECSPIGTRKFCGKRNRDGSLNKGRSLERTCKTCDRFFTTKTSQWECRKCQSKRIRRARKEEAVSILGGSCIKCGYDKCIDALDFHHKDPKLKKTEVSNLIDAACFWDEVKKCVLLCCRCHTELHAGMFDL